jgi:hypothetical protein
MTTSNCPYCNEVVDTSAAQAPGFTSACCNRFIAVREDVVVKKRLFVPSSTFAQKSGIQGDVSHVPGMPRLDNMRPESSWTTVCMDTDGYQIRFSPKDVDLESLGFSHGLCLRNSYDSVYAAHEAADVFDQFFEGIKSLHEHDYTQLHTDYAFLQARIATAVSLLESEDSDDAWKVLQGAQDGTEFVDMACAIYWDGGYGIYTDPNLAIAKCLDLDGKNQPYKITYLIETFSRHNGVVHSRFFNGAEDERKGEA